MANLSCGIVGLPNVGKSTLFNVLIRGSAPSSNYPFCTIDPNIGIVEVFDPRLEKLAEISKSKKIVHATMQFSDIAGLVEGASQGEGLGNKFLSHIRETDAIIHIVRCFENDNVVHVSGSVDPIRDIETINLELILADLQSIENIIGKVERQAKGNKEMAAALNCLKKVKAHLDDNKSARMLELTEEEKNLLKPYPLLTNKKILYVANVDEESIENDNEHVKKVKECAEKEGNSVIKICASLEEELVKYSEEESEELLESFGVKETGLHKLIKASFEMLGLITFITTGEPETRSWTIKKDSTAPEAAGKIHTDIQRGFIRAEVATFDDVVQYNGRQGVKEAGKMKTEGKEYIVKEGDVILFLHN